MFLNSKKTVFLYINEEMIACQFQKDVRQLGHILGCTSFQNQIRH